MRATLLAVAAGLCCAAPASAAPFVQATLSAAGGDASGTEGFSLAVSGDGSTIVAGAPGAASLTGLAYVYERNSGQWMDEFAPAKLTAPGGAAGDQFGSSVAVSNDGSVIVAGAPYVSGAGQQRGAVYVFLRGPSGWHSGVQAVTLTASTPADYDRLGSSVAVSGDGSLIAAGTPSPGSFQGAVYLFARPSGGWADGTHEFAKFTGGAAGDRLGASVAISGDGSVVAAGAPGASSNAGAAEVFQRTIVYGWRLTGTLTASAGTAGDQLGSSVATSGGAVVAGAPSWNSGHGAAYLFLKPTINNLQGLWRNTTEAARLSAPAAAAGDVLGSSVAISGDGSLVAAGAPTTTSLGSPGTGPGSVYLFTHAGSNFANGPKLTASDGATGDAFGWSVAMSSQGLAAAGSPRATLGQGVAYAFTGPSETAVNCQPASVKVTQSATCTATVSDGGLGAVAPTGAVLFSSDSDGAFSGNVLGTFGEGPHCNLAAGGSPGTATCQITYTPNATGDGTHTITGAYGGDSGHAPSQGSTELGATLAATTATVSCTPRTIAVGHAVPCTAMVTDVTAGDPAPGGLVTFLTDSRGSFGGQPTCALKAGTCTLPYAPAAVGRFATHEISIHYEGDAEHSSSFGTTQLSVTRSRTATTVRCRATTHRLFSCTATVSETGSGTATPTGRVTLGRRSCRLRASRRPGVARCGVAIKNATPGRHRITAAYGGDGNHFGSTGSTLVRAAGRGGSR